MEDKKKMKSKIAKMMHVAPVSNIDGCFALSIPRSDVAAQDDIISGNLI